MREWSLSINFGGRGRENFKLLLQNSPGRLEKSYENTSQEIWRMRICFLSVTSWANMFDWCSKLLHYYRYGRLLRLSVNMFFHTVTFIWGLKMCFYSVCTSICIYNIKDAKSEAYRNYKFRCITREIRMEWVNSAYTLSVINNLCARCKYNWVWCLQVARSNCPSSSVSVFESSAFRKLTLCPSSSMKEVNSLLP
jgi:hypothetical protein